MHDLVITAAIILAVLLIHVSYVDFRFRYRDGIRWFWLLNPAPPIIWLARATFVAALGLAFSVPFVGTDTVIYLTGIMVVLHLLSLVLVELLEPR